MKNKIKFIIILFIIISTIFIVGITNARYMLEANVRSDLDLAIPRMALVGVTNTIEAMLPGDTRSFDFNLNNYENSKTNEVLMQCYINVNVTTEEFPLTYKVYSLSGGNQTELTQTANGFGPVTLNYGTQESNQYRIIFTWDANNNNDSYANKNYAFQIQTEATQVI